MQRSPMPRQDRVGFGDHFGVTGARGGLASLAPLPAAGAVFLIIMYTQLTPLRLSTFSFSVLRLTGHYVLVLPSLPWASAHSVR